MQNRTYLFTNLFSDIVTVAIVKRNLHGREFLVEIAEKQQLCELLFQSIT